METEPGKPPLTPDSGSSSSDRSEELQKVAKLPIRESYNPNHLRKVAQGRRPGVSLPYFFLNDPTIAKGMQELDNFGFRTNEVQMDPTRTFLITGRRKQTGFHVSDLWSQRQQQEFLKRLRLERAQYARERQLSFVNYLILNKKRLFRDVELEPAGKQASQPLPQFRSQDRISSVPSQTVIMRSARSMSDLPLDEIASPQAVPHEKKLSGTARKRLTMVDGLITHCNSTLQRMKKDLKALPKTSQVSKSRKAPLFDSVDYQEKWWTKLRVQRSKSLKKLQRSSSISLVEKKLRAQRSLQGIPVSPSVNSALSPDLSYKSPGLRESFSFMSRSNSQEHIRLCNESVRVSSPTEIMERLSQLDQSIRAKVEETFVSSRAVDEAALLQKVLAVEKAPKKSTAVTKAEGLSYDKPPLCSSTFTASNKLYTRKVSAVRGKAALAYKEEKVKMKKKPRVVILKSKKAILRDFQQTQEQSFHFLQSVHSLSKQLSRHFLRAPVLRPRSNAFSVLDTCAKTHTNPLQ